MAIGTPHRAYWCQLKVQPIVRQGLKPLPQSESPLKRTEKKIFKLISPMQEDFRY